MWCRRTVALAVVSRVACFYCVLLQRGATRGATQPLHSLLAQMSANKDHKKKMSEEELFTGLPGEPYRKWRRRLLDLAADDVDTAGFSRADHLLDIDPGGAAPGAAAMPGGPAMAAAVRLRTIRAKESYALIKSCLLNPDIEQILSTNHFQDGLASFQYLDATYDTPIRQSDLRVLDQRWNGETASPLLETLAVRSIP